MKTEITSNINSYDDLKLARIRLKSEIKQQEKSFLDNSAFKIASSLFTSTSKSPFDSPLSFSSISSSLKSSSNLKSIAENLIGTLLISNKITRRYYIAYTIAKEMVPFTIKKVNELIKN